MLAAILAVESSDLGTVSAISGQLKGITQHYHITRSVVSPLVFVIGIGTLAGTVGKARKTYLRDVATAAASSRADKS